MSVKRVVLLERNYFYLIIFACVLRNRTDTGGVHFCSFSYTNALQWVSYWTPSVTFWGELMSHVSNRFEGIAVKKKKYIYK